MSKSGSAGSASGGARPGRSKRSGGGGGGGGGAGGSGPAGVPKNGTKFGGAKENRKSEAEVAGVMNKADGSGMSEGRRKARAMQVMRTMMTGKDGGIAADADRRAAAAAAAPKKKGSNSQRKAFAASQRRKGKKPSKKPAGNQPRLF